MADVVQLQFTVEDEGRAQALLARLLEARFIACGQILGPIRSRYWWKGAMEQATEWLCLCKTTQGRVEDITSVIREDHPDEVPEVIVVPVTDGLGDYLAWVRAEVGGGGGVPRS